MDFILLLLTTVLVLILIVVCPSDSFELLLLLVCVIRDVVHLVSVFIARLMYVLHWCVSSGAVKCFKLLNGVASKASNLSESESRVCCNIISFLHFFEERNKLIAGCVLPCNKMLVTWPTLQTVL